MKITVNGKTYKVVPEATILEALEAHGLSVPTLCHDSRFSPSSACRLCEVQVQGQSRNPCACATLVTDGMVVETHTPELEHYRKEILKMLARGYPRDAVTKDPEKPLHQLLRFYGVVPPGEDIALETKSQVLVDNTHPYIAVDMNRCIHCYRCVHICDKVQGQFVWKIINRGAETHVVWDQGGSLKESSCVSCGACVDTCPSGALEDVSRMAGGVPQAWTRTTCPYCGVGCEMDVGVKDDRIVAVRPTRDAPVNKGHLCVKGRYGWAYVDAPTRVTKPMVRQSRNEPWREVSWNEALTQAARELQQVQARYGEQALGVVGSARATNEDSFLAQKFARVVLKTNNVDCCARVCHAPSAAGLGAVFGTGAATNSFNDIEKAQAFLIVGANPTENHPIVGARIKQKVLSGTPLVVIDPRRTELAALAQVHLAPRPGTNLPLFHALAHVLIAEGFIHKDFISKRTEGFEEYARFIKLWPPERAAEICGVRACDIVAAARIYGVAYPAMCMHGLGVTEHIQGTEGVMALAQLALLTGNVGIAGSGMNPLRGQNNVQGTAVMGCEPHKLTGSQKIAVAGPTHEKLWGVKLPQEKGKTLLEMMDAAAAGTLKGMLVIGYDVYLTNPNVHETEKALSQLESLIVVDLFMNETAKTFGTVFLPVVSSFEKDGTFMNAERRIQRVRAALRSRGEAKTDIDVLCALAERMGFGETFMYSGPEQVWSEIRQLWSAVKGMSYGRLDVQGLQWPCPDEKHPGTEILHKEKFPIGDRVKFVVLDYRASLEKPSAEFPYLLNTGRSLFHFNAATMTGHSRNRELQSDEILQIHPLDAKLLGVKEGMKVNIESAHGTAVAQAQVTEAVRPGELFATFHKPENFLNRVTGSGRDNVTHTPEYKVTAVRVVVRPL